MISQSEIHIRLNQIWQIFTTAGVTDPLTIIENLAYFFLREQFQIGDDLYGVSSSRHQMRESQQSTRDGFMSMDLLPDLMNKLPDLKGFPDIKQLVPQFTGSLGRSGYLQIGHAVHGLLQEYSPAAQIFNEALPEFLERMEPGGRYFTPRHLTLWASSLLDLFPGARLADFACGSGGFLVATTEKLPQVTGGEISPNWARLAFTNCLLHGIRKPDIRIGNSLSIFGRREKETRFDSILMNPPFGAKVDEALVNYAFDLKLSGRSETVLTWLALENLADNGQMVVFLPSGSLFANNTGEQVLREELIENGELAAVVTLPKDAFQPYSQIDTHALFIEKTSDPAYINWFYRPRYDGFTSGRNRQPDPKHNDLPLITAAIRSRKDTASIVPLKVEGKELAGYRVLLNPKVVRFGIHKLILDDADKSCFLVEFGPDPKQGYYWIDQMEIIETDDQKHPIDINFPKSYKREINNTLFQGTYSIHLTNLEGEIRVGRHSSLLKIQSSWIDSSWMGVIIDSDGHLLGPAFSVESPDRIMDLEETIFAFDTNDAASEILILFSPGKLEGVMLSDNIYLINCGKQHWIKLSVEVNNPAKFDIFHQEESGVIFNSDGRQSGVVFNRIGNVLGVAVPSHFIQQNNLDLQPSSYFPLRQETEEAGLQSPAGILADITMSQIQLSRQIQRLLSLAEMKPASNEEIPPAVLKSYPLGKLQGIQKRIWKEIIKCTEEYEGNVISSLFQLRDLEVIEEPTAEVEKTIELFERMGLIVKVSVDKVHYYRLVNEHDNVGGPQA